MEDEAKHRVSARNPSESGPQGGGARELSVSDVLPGLRPMDLHLKLDRFEVESPS